MTQYRYHVFFCTNIREEGKTCCGRGGAADLRAHAKDRIKALGLNGQGGVRINTAGCMGRCCEGPVIVVYPEGTWYTYVDQDDIDEIIDSHLVEGRIVERLLL